MTVLPVIDRELRTQARLGFTYVLRMLGAGVALLFSIYFSGLGGISNHLGGVLFWSLHGLQLISIWVLVPLSCADCISRERREGTLGLLFLTPLKAREIVLSKGLAHGLRAVTLWLAAAPILTICFLIGGLTWKEAVVSGLVNFSSICWALAAGLLASSSTKSWLRAMILSSCIGACFLFGFIYSSGVILNTALRYQPVVSLRYGYYFGGFQGQTPDTLEILKEGFFGITNLQGLWGNPFGTLAKAGQRAWLAADIEMVLLSICFLWGVILFAAWIMRRSWREEPPSARRVWMEQALSKPIIGVKFFRRWLRRKLERNPMGWLEQRSWTGRIVTWGWFAVVVSFYSVVFYVPKADAILRGLQNIMAWSLLVVLASTASGSFQRERETRVLELLLVSPMTAKQIIRGRLRGLWEQFLPSVMLMLFVWVYLESFFKGGINTAAFFCCGFLTLPVIGLYYSLRRINFMSALLSTMAVGILLPLFAVRALLAGLSLGYMGLGFGVLADNFARSPSMVTWLLYPCLQLMSSPNFPLGLQALIAIHLGRKLHHDLENRDFPFSKGAA